MRRARTLLDRESSGLPIACFERHRRWMRDHRRRSGIAAARWPGMRTTDVLTLDDRLLAPILGGVRTASYLDAAVRGAVDGAFTGAAGGASMLPFAAASGPLTPLAALTIAGGSTALGAVVGAGNGMWDLYKSRHPLAVGEGAAP